MEDQARRSVADIARNVRACLADNSSQEDERVKAAVRRLVHESVVGFDERELLSFIEALRSRFPDRTYEAATRVRSLDSETVALRSEVARLAAENTQLRSKMSSLETALTDLRADLMAGFSTERGGSLSPDDERRSLRALAGIVGLLMNTVIDQDQVRISVEKTIARPGAAASDSGPAVRDLVAAIASGHGDPSAHREALQRRLDELALVPAALLAGVQQSWRAGTRQVIEQLGPNSAEQAVGHKVPGMRDVAVLKEVRRRFDDFWNQFDRNIAHYYRGVFEKVYSEKMEERR